MKKQTKQTIEGIIGEIIDTACERLKFELGDKYVCVCVYDCGGAWQVWLNWGRSGKKPSGEVLVNGNECYEQDGDSLIRALRTFLGLVEEKKIEAVK